MVSLNSRKFYVVHQGIVCTAENYLRRDDHRDRLFVLVYRLTMYTYRSGVKGETVFTESSLSTVLVLRPSPPRPLTSEESHPVNPPITSSFVDLSKTRGTHRISLVFHWSSLCRSKFRLGMVQDRPIGTRLIGETRRSFIPFMMTELS